MSTDKLLKRLSDGTLQTTKSVKRMTNIERVAAAHHFVGTTVEIELRDVRGSRTVIGDVIAAALAHNGGSGIIVVRGIGDVIPDAYSLATVHSIAGLTAMEYARLVNA